MDLVSANSLLGPRNIVASVANYGVERQSDFLDAAGVFCSVMQISANSPVAGKLGEGFNLASAATGCAGLMRDTLGCVGAASEIASSWSNPQVSVVSGVKHLTQGVAATVYDCSKVAQFANSTGAYPDMPSWLHTAGKGYGLGTLAVIGLSDDLQELQKPTQIGMIPLQNELLESRWWMHAWNVGANLSTLIYAVSVVAGYVLAPALGLFLATAYLVCAVASYVYKKDMEQAVVRSVLIN